MFLFSCCSYCVFLLWIPQPFPLRGKRKGTCNTNNELNFPGVMQESTRASEKKQPREHSTTDLLVDITDPARDERQSGFILFFYLLFQMLVLKFRTSLIILGIFCLHLYILNFLTKNKLIGDGQPSGGENVVDEVSLSSDDSDSSGYTRRCVPRVNCPEKIVSIVRKKPVKLFSQYCMLWIWGLTLGKIIIYIILSEQIFQVASICRSIAYIVILYPQRYCP